MRSKLWHWLIVLMLPVLASCYPGGAEYYEELDLVYTNYNNEYDFAAQHTYAVNDSVPKIGDDSFNDPDGDGEPDFMDPVYSVPLLASIRQNMTAAGWTEVDENNSPDVILLVDCMTTTNIYYYYDWWYWGWYYPGWYPGWGWYYPGYYPPYYITGYRSGTISMRMTDPDPVIGGGNIATNWIGIINGLAEGGTTNLVSRIQASVDKAFIQSPYLKH